MLIVKKNFNRESVNVDKCERMNDIFVSSIITMYESLLEKEGTILLNDMYESLGMARTQEGCMFGWSWEKDKEIKIDTKQEDGDLILIFYVNLVLENFKKE